MSSDEGDGEPMPCDEEAFVYGICPCVDDRTPEAEVDTGGDVDLGAHGVRAVKGQGRGCRLCRRGWGCDIVEVDEVQFGGVVVSTGYGGGSGVGHTIFFFVEVDGVVGVAELANREKGAV